MSEAIESADIVRDGQPLLDRAQAVYASIEHEAMHQETLLYILHRLPFDQKRRPCDLTTVAGGEPPAPATVSIPAGCATLGARRDEVAFGWDNEFESFQANVPGFTIDVYDLTNRGYLEFIEAGGYDTKDWWTREG